MLYKCFVFAGQAGKLKCFFFYKIIINTFKNPEASLLGRIKQLCIQ